MNYAWCGMIVISFICACINGSISQTMDAMFEGAKESVFTLLSFTGVMCFWTGILKVGEDAGISKFLQMLFAPIIRLLFPKSGPKAREFIALNISANILGMGNAATPMGIKAMEELDRENPVSDKPSKSMCLFTILNTSCFTLIPSSVIALRTAAGSAAPYDIILPTWGAALSALFIGCMIIMIFKHEK